MYKITISLLLSVLYAFTVAGQQISIEISKDEFKIDEIIEVKYIIDRKIDSVVLPDFEDFDIVSDARESSSMTVKNAVARYEQSWTYELQPTKGGKFTIPAPVFFQNGKKLTKEGKSITVLESKLTAAEEKALQFDAFIEDYTKPKGTLRFIVHGEFGYIEKYDMISWEFYRKMTPEEIALFKGIE